MKINKSIWDTILKVAIAVLSAIAGALGVNAMNWWDEWLRQEFLIWESTVGRQSGCAFRFLGEDGGGFVFFLSRKTAIKRTNISVFLNISLKYIVLSYRNIIFVVQTLKIATVYLKTKLKGGGYQKEKIWKTLWRPASCTSAAGCKGSEEVSLEYNGVKTNAKGESVTNNIHNKYSFYG